MLEEKRKTGSKILSNSPKHVAQLPEAPAHHGAICISWLRCSAEIVSGPGVHFLLKTSRITSSSSILRVTAGPKRLRPSPAEGTILQVGMRGGDAGMGFASGCCLGRCTLVLHAQRHAQPPKKAFYPGVGTAGSCRSPSQPSGRLCKGSWRHRCP